MNGCRDNVCDAGGRCGCCRDDRRLTSKPQTADLAKPIYVRVHVWITGRSRGSPYSPPTRAGTTYATAQGERMRTHRPLASRGLATGFYYAGWSRAASRLRSRSATSKEIAVRKCDNVQHWCIVRF